MPRLRRTAVAAAAASVATVTALALRARAQARARRNPAPLPPEDDGVYRLDDDSILLALTESAVRTVYRLSLGEALDLAERLREAADDDDPYFYR